MTAGYVPGSGSEAFKPAVMPRSCVYASMGNEACVLVVHHVRERKTGPQIPVTVLWCRTHRRAFTLYPIGHVPYGRRAIAPVGLDGEVVFSTEREPREPREPPEPPEAPGKRLPAWRMTLFESAFAAIHEQTVKLTDPRWWATEAAEQLARGAAIVGVHPDLSVPEADAIAFRLEIPRLVLRQAADAYERGRGRAARGRVIVDVLGQLGDRCLLDRLLAAGACAGCWGAVTRWDAASSGARGRVFPGRGAPAG
ncbi:MAG: hypothetical protein LH654_06980 [Thermoleophilia bacterium]|nr:hypothetical protein [Thermoleophilia bacterium]